MSPGLLFALEVENIAGLVVDILPSLCDEPLDDVVHDALIGVASWPALGGVFIGIPLGVPTVADAGPPELAAP